MGDTKPLDATKCCSICGVMKSLDRIVPKRNVCRDCCNSRRKERQKELVIDPNEIKTCNICSQSKPYSSFTRGLTCADCHNEKRRNKYKTDEDLRQKAIQQATVFKQKKATERREKKLEEIGVGNKKCSVCSTIKSNENFRHNRLKCKDCERDDPLDKFKRNVRSRIYLALKKNKEMRTVKYLGCTSPEYLQWILSYDVNYNLENHGKIWHIDHIIPLSRFNLEDKEEQLIAFNWRNTMPLSAKANLSKNAKIITSQIEQHLEHLKKYQTENNTELPQKFIDLFAKHLVDGNPLKQSLPLAIGNSSEDLG
jgi:hypothetical protein